MNIDQLKPNKVLRGPIFPEPVQVIVVIPMGDAVKLIAKGVNTARVYEPILTLDNLAALETTPDTQPFDGEAQRFRLGVEALRLSLAYEYDPYFSLSIARVDPLPHQLEAVYQYFMAMPRIRFLLADDPGAGKTIMAGLLLKELKVRGLVSRTLILTPASLSFQWQREMKDKFRENFEVIRSDVLRANYGSNPWQDKNQVITSVSWVSRIEDAKESLLRSHWDLIIVDEAHKMSAASRDKKTLAYQLGEALSQMTDHYLLMTATPHNGDPDNFCLFLELLDRDVYGDVKSLEEAMRPLKALAQIGRSNGQVNPGRRSTLRDFLKKVESQYGKADRIWLMDRGIPTEEVLKEMRTSDPPIHYLVGTPKGRLTKLEAELLPLE
jgi:SNF2 family DNA or RNA helicase